MTVISCYEEGTAYVCAPEEGTSPKLFQQIQTTNGLYESTSYCFCRGDSGSMVQGTARESSVCSGINLTHAIHLKEVANVATLLTGKCEYYYIQLCKRQANEKIAI